jgi:SpoVK/Ycf46/Vps4 family AAA+-type ATPase
MKFLKKRGLVLRYRTKNNLVFDGRIPEYLVNVIKNLKEGIFNVNLLNHLFENLSESQQEDLNLVLTEFVSHFTQNSNQINLKKKGRFYEDSESSLSTKTIENVVFSLSKKERSHFFDLLVNFIEQQNKSIKKNVYSRIKKSKKNEEKIFKSKLENLKKFLNLDEIEIQVVEFVYYITSNEFFLTLFQDTLRYYNLSLMISLFLDEDEYKIKSVLQKKSKLIQYGVIDIIDVNELQLNEEIYEYLIDISSFDFTDKFFKVIDPNDPQNNVLDLSLFNFYKDKIKILQALLKSEGKTNILFYGQSGTGKTSLAKSVIASLNKKIIYVSNSPDVSSDKDNHFSNRITSLIITCNYAKDNDGIVIMDEADDFLNSHFSVNNLFFRNAKGSGSIQKNWLNDFLESHDYKIIWITNHTMLMDESVKRRFDYSIHFNTFNGETREYIIKKILKKYELEKSIELQDLKEYFFDLSIPIGIIENALYQVHQILKVNPLTKSEMIQIARELLNSSYELVYNNRLKTISYDRTYYDIDFIHAAPEPYRVLNQIENFIKNNKNKQKNLNCLFYGLPGTGKTEFARYIAQKINYRVIEIQPSDIKHPLFGVSEQLLGDYFRKASKGNIILIVNEIDVFLSKELQHEVNHSIQQQFIQEMENFKGILIGTTNSIDRIPLRAKRRFHLKVEFLPIKKEKLTKVFLRFFSEHLPTPQLSPEQLKKLEQLENLTIGDFYIVKRQIEYEGELYFEEIYQKLSEENYYKLHDKN